jgi:hypothetical protein
MLAGEARSTVGSSVRTAAESLGLCNGTNEERRPQEMHAVDALLSEGSGAASVTGIVVFIGSAGLGDELVLKLPLGGKAGVHEAYDASMRHCLAARLRVVERWTT